MTDKKGMHDKPLDKMTVTELREVAKEIPGMTGVHGMKKAELLTAIEEAEGVVVETSPKTTKAKAKPKTALTVREIKALIKGLRSQRDQALAEKDKKTAMILRRRISKLKKKTRKAA